MTKAPEFWWQPNLSAKAALLMPAGWIYGAVAARRMRSRPKAKSRLPVICIGNFVAGGTGKTPFAIRLAERLSEEGHAPGFLLRGYGGKHKGPLPIDPDRHDAAIVGDEALMLASVGPTIVSADRAAGAALAESLEIDILLMDDGFQNPALAKDLTIVLVDAAVGFGNGQCIPAGPLRAPVRAQILKADCLIVVGKGEAAEPAIHLAARKGLPILHAHVEPSRNDALIGRKLFAYAGIGRPEKFFQTLKDQGLDVKQTRAFADHHLFTEQDARALITQAEENGLQLVTTAKDMARLETGSGELMHWLASRSEVLDVDMVIEEEDRLIALINERLRRRQFQTG
ncbi:tetraacyldisaccharide 4'-kinase [Roseibium denhamense]|uniref:Tetraacyldisaccharide 4'-kinase n=1 Tax=Roseibium denhamense TaxID=76305 RepID=A0ABY1P3I7_9HYPH|nr:tetraacyldisaccharide 4'-kinase [Roseibium denhamense]MTI07712.1 tetraacyldisaccharide 4'-kinase [Roseibium denhamense]SMP24810.1 lipid-A-disaccharide kinase [Roseibium denhamense]